VDLQTDPSNCGTIGMACASGQVCQAGGCTGGGCGGSLQNCGGACVDVRVDPLNCDGCGRTCNRDQICVRGSCQDFRPAVGCTMCPCPSCTGDIDQCCPHPGRPADLICAERCP